MSSDSRNSERFDTSVVRNWRLTFRFDDGDAFDLNYEDYHR
jgi:proteic killer suppression protein